MSWEWNISNIQTLAGVVSASLYCGVVATLVDICTSHIPTRTIKI